MSESDEVEVVRGSGNVFRDLRLPDADTEQMKSALAAEILKAMREQGLTHAAAAARAEVQRADISRICKVDLDRVTIDRLARIAEPPRSTGRGGRQRRRTASRSQGSRRQISAVTLEAGQRGRHQATFVAQWPRYANSAKSGSTRPRQWPCNAATW